MLAVKSHRRIYLSFYEIYSPSCRRYKSVFSAVKQGLRAEDKSYIKSRIPGRDRSAKVDSPSRRSDPNRRASERPSRPDSGYQGRPNNRTPDSSNRPAKDWTSRRDIPSFQSRTGDGAQRWNRSRDQDSSRSMAANNDSFGRKDRPRTFDKSQSSVRYKGRDNDQNARDISESRKDRSLNAGNYQSRPSNYSAERERDGTRPNGSPRGNRDLSRSSVRERDSTRPSGQQRESRDFSRSSARERDLTRPNGYQRENRDFSRSNSNNADRSSPRTPTSKADDEENIPQSIPYTTAASVFLYGTNSVLAALRGKRRKAYRLHLAPASAANYSAIQTMTELAKKSGVGIKEGVHPRLLEQMTARTTKGGEARPHNGVVLEASTLPAPPVQALGKPSLITRTAAITLGTQSTEEAAVNGMPATLSFPTHRQPFVLFVDGILDPGNLGNIIRTAYFYNVDAIAVATNTCAPLSSAVLAKASAGACEAIPIFALPQPANFIFASRKEGWKIYAAAPETENSNKNRQLTTADLKTGSPVLSNPCILMMGAEGEGLRSSLSSKADYFVSIEQETPQLDVGVESLNVAVATGVLLEGFMGGINKQSSQPNSEEDRLF